MIFFNVFIKTLSCIQKKLPPRPQQSPPSFLVLACSLWDAGPAEWGYAWTTPRFCWFWSRRPHDLWWKNLHMSRLSTLGYGVMWYIIIDTSHQVPLYKKKCQEKQQKKDDVSFTHLGGPARSFFKFEALARNHRKKQQDRNQKKWRSLEITDHDVGHSLPKESYPKPLSPQKKSINLRFCSIISSKSSNFFGGGWVLSKCTHVFLGFSLVVSSQTPPLHFPPLILSPHPLRLVPTYGAKKSTSTEPSP